MPCLGNMKAHTASIAIPTFRRTRVLLNTIAFAQACSPAPRQIIVVDQSPDFDPVTRQALVDMSSRGEIVLITTNQTNLPGARNLALKACTSSVLIYVDDDVEFGPGFVDSHTSNYVGDVSGVAGRVLHSDRPAASNRTRLQDPSYDYLYLDLASPNRIDRVGTFRGCNFSAYVCTLRSLGGFDENFRGWAFREDADMALRIFRAGHKLVFDPEASVVHLAAPSGGCRREHAWSFANERDLAFPEAYFLAKHFAISPHFVRSLLIHFRRIVMRKRSLAEPWLLLPRSIAFVAALIEALGLCRASQTRSPRH
jgi:GT2 family glycosyltransferase